MNSEAVLAELRAAFPQADEVAEGLPEMGLGYAVGVRKGDRWHAVKVFDGDLGEAIDRLRKWGAK